MRLALDDADISQLLRVTSALVFCHREAARGCTEMMNTERNQGPLVSHSLFSAGVACGGDTGSAEEGCKKH